MIPTVHIHHPAAIILAAGSSTRFGEAKLLRHYQGKSLLQHAVEAATAVAPERVLVITGAWQEQVSATVANAPVTLVHNDGHEEGMASSIRKGVASLSSISEVDGCFILVADQPHVDAALLLRLLVRQDMTRLPMVASHYGDVIGTPVLFHKSVFPELMSLQGDKGARGLLQAKPERVATVLFPDGAVDIDTPEDYERLMNPHT